MKTLFDRQKPHKPIAITQTDEALFKALYDYDILSVEHLCAELQKPSTQYMRKRLKVLYDHGYVARPPIQDKIYSHRTGTGSRPLVHSLGQRGAVYLQEKFGHVLKTTNWDDKARNRSGQRGESIFEHDLGANGVLIDLRKAYDTLDDVTVLGPKQIIDRSPNNTTLMDKPFSLPVKYIWPTENKMHTRNVIPDGVFVYDVDREEVNGSWMVFLEYDNDTMPLKRTRGDHTSIQQKIAAYIGLHKSGLVKQRFGVNRFQVMFVTTGTALHRAGMGGTAKEYIESIRDPVPESLFNFTTLGEIEEQSILEKIWVSAEGRFKKIIKG